MAKTKLPPLTKTILLGVATAVSIFSFNVCAAQQVFLVSSVASAARDTIKIRKDRNNNYLIKIQLENLTEPGRFQPTEIT